MVRIALFAIVCLIVTNSTLAFGTPPNVFIIFIDDMGYGDIGPFGSDHPTPHLDRMAKEGIKLTDFYVSSSTCTPSRSALLTSCYADRIGMGKSVVFPADKRGLNTKEITIAEILKKAGYATGCFGKWHLGEQNDLRKASKNREGIANGARCPRRPNRVIDPSRGFRGEAKTSACQFEGRAHFG